MAGEFDYDLVVLDLSLPRLDGVAILCAICVRANPACRIIILTGRTRIEDRVECSISEPIATVANPSRSRSCRRGSGRCCGAAIFHGSLNRDDSPFDHEVRFFSAAAVRGRLWRIPSHRQQ